MNSRIMLLFAAAAMTLGVSAVAAQPPVAEFSVAEGQQGGAWLVQMRDAMTLNSESLQALAQLGGLMDPVRSAAQVKVAARQARAVIADARTKAEQAAAALAVIRPPRLDLGGGVTPAGALAEAQEQNRKVLALFDVFDAFVAAIEKGDRAMLGALEPKVRESSLLVIETNRLFARNRQLTFSRSDSAYQTMGVIVQLERAAGAAARAWLQSRHGRVNEPAVAELRRELAGVAVEVRALAEEGRKNLSREQADNSSAEKGDGRGDTQAVAGLLAEEAKVFVIADELASVAERNKQIPAASLTQRESPELMKTLADLEARVGAISAAQAEIAAGNSE